VPQLDQLTVNEYTPGVGIAPHVDAHSSFTGAITALSLLGSCVMVFRKGYTASTNPDRIHLPHVQASLQQQQQRRQEHGQQQGVEQQQQQQDQQVHVFLPPRTLVVMAGECRYGW
jgi:alkylated DNA repair protein alkB family protein 8